MPNTKNAKPEATFRQLCAVAKRELLAATTIDSVEWKERIKDRITRDGYQRPLSEQVYRAMDATERANPDLRSRIRDLGILNLPKPAPPPPDPTIAFRRPHPKDAPATGFRTLQDLIAKYQQTFSSTSPK